MALTVSLLICAVLSSLGHTAIAVDSGKDIAAFTSKNDRTCQPSNLYKSSIPAGGKSVDHLQVIGVSLSATDCINKCCEMGQARCQYLWVFEDTCIAVACDEGKESSCRPREVTKKFDSSVYVKVKHNPVDNELQKVLEWIKNYVPPTTEVGDYPPLANAGPKELTIKLPSSDMHIYLYGNKSKDDKGIVSHSWELISEHFVQPILENADQAVLHVRGLIPGTYTFKLTVKDTSGQTADTTVIVHVVEDPTHANSTTEKIKATESTTSPFSTGPSPSPTQPPEEENKSVHPTPDKTRPINQAGNGDTVPSPTAVLKDIDADQQGNLEEYYTKRRNVLRIVIPVLLSLAFILILSALVTTACACCCERNRQRMKRYYKYKRIPETIEKM